MYDDVPPMGKIGKDVFDDVVGEVLGPVNPAVSNAIQQNILDDAVGHVLGAEQMVPFFYTNVLARSNGCT